MDWIEDILENTYRNYKKRKVVLWGKYSVSETIADRLLEVYGIDTAFYVDRDPSKIDSRQVFPTGCLQGKADEYYVVVPVAYYQSLKEELIEGDIKKTGIITISAIALLKCQMIIMRIHMEIK